MFGTIISCIEDLIFKIAGKHVNRKRSITKENLQRVKDIQQAEKEFEETYVKFKVVDNLSIDNPERSEVYYLFKIKIKRLEYYFPTEITKARIANLNLAGEYTVYNPKDGRSISDKEGVQEKSISDNLKILKRLKDKDPVSNDSKVPWIGELLVQYNEVVEQLGKINVNKFNSTDIYSIVTERKAILDIINKYFSEIQDIIDIYLKIEEKKISISRKKYPF